MFWVSETDSKQNRESITILLGVVRPRRNGDGLPDIRAGWRIADSCDDLAVGGPGAQGASLCHFRREPVTRGISETATTHRTESRITHIQNFPSTGSTDPPQLVVSLSTPPTPPWKAHAGPHTEVGLGRKSRKPHHGPSAFARVVQPGSHLHLPPEHTPFNEQSSSVWQGGGGGEGAGGLGAGGGAGALGIGTGHLPLTSTHPLT